MSSASNPSVIPLNSSSETIPVSTEDLFSGYEEIQKEIKAEVEKYFEEFNSIQKSHADRLENFETAYTEEIKKIKELFSNIGGELDKFKNHIKEFVEVQIKSETQNLSKFQHELSNRLDQTEQLISTITPDSPNSKIEDIREEFIEGIRLLGKRISKAIQDMDNRFQEFTEQVETVPQSEEFENAGDLLQPEDIEKMEQTSDYEFGTIKESDLLDSNDYEVIHKKSIEKLSQLFRKQSEGMRKIIESNKAKIKEFEKQIKTYEIERAKFSEILNIKIKRNFRFSMIGIGVLAVSVVIFQFVI